MNRKRKGVDEGSGEMRKKLESADAKRKEEKRSRVADDQCEGAFINRDVLMLLCEYMTINSLRRFYFIFLMVEGGGG